jgi:inner membrane protein
MDNVTHSLAGWMMARAGIDRRVPRAAALMILSANLPDIDVVSGLRGTLTYLEFHRGYAHSLAFAPALAIVPPLLFFALFRQRITIAAYLFSLLGILSHVLFDWTNVYGIRMLLPFSDRWLRLDITDIVDPWILTLLLLAVAAPALAKLVSSEIGSRSGPGPKRGWAWFALLGILAYEGSRYVAHERALAVMGAHLYNGSIPRRLTALPTRGNLWRWRGVAEGEGFIDLVPVDLSEMFDPADGRIEYEAPPGPLIDRARATPPFEVFSRFNQLPFWKVTPLAEATSVELIDLRFGTPEAPGFEARAVVDQPGGVRESRFTFGAVPVNP